MIMNISGKPAKLEQINKTMWAGHFQNTQDIYIGTRAEIIVHLIEKAHTERSKK